MFKKAYRANSGMKQGQRVAHGKSGRVIGAPNKTSAPSPQQPPAGAQGKTRQDIIPVDPTRATVPIPGLPAGKRRS